MVVTQNYIQLSLPFDTATDLNAQNFRQYKGFLRSRRHRSSVPCYVRLGSDKILKGAHVTGRLKISNSVFSIDSVEAYARSASGPDDYDTRIEVNGYSRKFRSISPRDYMFELVCDSQNPGPVM